MVTSKTFWICSSCMGVGKFSWKLLSFTLNTGNEKWKPPQTEKNTSILAVELHKKTEVQKQTNKNSKIHQNTSHWASFPGKQNKTKRTSGFANDKQTGVAKSAASAVDPDWLSAQSVAVLSAARNGNSQNERKKCVSGGNSYINRSHSNMAAIVAKDNSLIRFVLAESCTADWPKIIVLFAIKDMGLYMSPGTSRDKFMSPLCLSPNQQVSLVN